MPEIKTLTGLRGYAALWVCVFHIALGWPADPSSWLLPLATRGNYGVSVFFVLSGFILSYVYVTWFTDRVSTASYLRFMRLRLARIYPLHLFLLLCTAALMAAGLVPRDRYDDAVTFGLNVLLLHGWGYPNSVSWNTASWTISVELFAYLLFPFAALMMHRHRLLGLALAAAYIAIAPMLHAKALAALGIDLTTVQFGYGTYVVRYFGMFLLGMTAFHVGQGVRSLGQREADVVAALGLAWLLGVGVYIGDPLGAIPYGSAILILGLSRDTGLGKAVFGNPLAVFLGNISYALYLSHVPLLLVCFMTGSTTAAKIGLFPILPAAIALATALHYLIELPARQWLRSRLQRVRRPVHDQLLPA